MKDKKIWEVLTEAKKYLARTREEYYPSFDKHRYICHCISEVHGTDPYEEDERTSPAHKLIRTRLGKFQDVQSWIEANVHGCYESEFDRFEQFQKYRHRWLYALIKEFKKKDL